MILSNGYIMTTTFPMDFSIADRFGPAAIEDTFNRSFESYKNNAVYLAELVLTLNMKIWQHYKDNEYIERVYDHLWRKAEQYAYENFTGDDLTTYFNITD